MLTVGIESLPGMTRVMRSHPRVDGNRKACFAGNVVPLRHPPTRFDSSVLFVLQTRQDNSINSVSWTGLEFA